MYEMQEIPDKTTVACNLSEEVNSTSSLSTSDYSDTDADSMPSDQDVEAPSR